MKIVQISLPSARRIALAASDFESHKGQVDKRPLGWWEWSDTKRALEWLFWAGHITTATRRGGFERVYDLPERVLPAEVLAAPTPSDTEVHRSVLGNAAKCSQPSVSTALKALGSERKIHLGMDDSYYITNNGEQALGHWLIQSDHLAIH